MGLLSYYSASLSDDTLSVTLGQVADVILVKIFVEGGSEQLLGQVGEDSCCSGDTEIIDFMLMVFDF